MYTNASLDRNQRRAIRCRIVISRSAFPRDEYLRPIGELAYVVSSLEWPLLGDLRCLAEHVPADLTVDDLAGDTIGKLA